MTQILSRIIGYIIVYIIIAFGGRAWLSRRMEIIRAKKLAALREAKRDHEQFMGAADLVMPLLKANPSWKWRDAVAHLHAQGIELPGNPNFEPYADKAITGAELSQTGAAIVLKRSALCASAPVAPVPYRTGNWSGAADPVRKPPRKIDLRR